MEEEALHWKTKFNSLLMKADQSALETIFPQEKGFFRFLFYILIETKCVNLVVLFLMKVNDRA